ncbi:hypothetical protein AALP_AA6G097600 [Arabis alpina]|uniref:Bifunctional inhibitor/plant lipid transfer protein/seed storage helical domain-containing protein n=1 Tax=Arabis alpina TaxID=50452 RepID=A0A087GN72_ARAAL|nr:hypothetical protein AALP_AA6G097600 [Arabis alpina]
MASKKMGMMMVVMAAIVVGRSVVAIELCGMSEAELNECKPAVNKESPTTPSQLCCNALEHADFNCLCGYKTSPWLGSFGIDPTLAVGLPTKCGLPNPPTC